MKVYGSYGDYYDITKIEMPRGSFGADKWIEFLYPVNTTDWMSMVAACTGVSNNDPNANPCPGLGEPEVTLDLRHPTDPHDAIDPDLCSEGQVREAAAAIAAWGRRSDVFGMLTPLLVGGKRPDPGQTQSDDQPDGRPDEQPEV